MADYIRPTPRNPIMGLLADALTGGVDWMRSPQRTQQMQGFGGLLADTGIPATVERLSYGEPLTTGRGMTTRLRPEAQAALMTLAPEAVPIGRAAMAGARAAGRGAMTVGRAGEQFAERVVPQVMERGGLPAQMISAMGQGTQSPMVVYHGSPYRFQRFDPTKIGSGEGAQVYGYGHYVAESPGVAKQYAENVKDMGAIRDINSRLSELARVMSADEVPGAYRKYKSDAGRRASEEYDALMAQRDIVRTAPGSLYTIDLPDPAIARMLNWDKPLSEQPKEVREALTKIAKGDEQVMRQFRELGPNATANQAYAALTQQAVRLKKYEGMRSGIPEAEAMPSLAYGQDVASRQLREAGIPGIRYLDQGSRGAGTGTSNFVVFPGEEDLLRIMSVNGGLLAP